MDQRTITDEETLTNLAGLDPYKYDQCREEEAKKLNIRVTTLDAEVKKRREKKSSDKRIIEQIEPWLEPVDGLELLEQVYQIIKDHVIISDASAVAISLWVLLTYCYDTFFILPILTLISPVKRCGKTTLLSVLKGLVNNGIMTSNISPAATYRVIEKYNPTLLADEADTFFKQNEELRGVYNSGHCRDSAYIVRCDSESNAPQMFSTWAPKALAMISSLAKLPDTIADRSVIVQMSRKTAGERVQRKSLTFCEDFRMTRRMLCRWGMDFIPELQRTEITLPNLGNDRLSDNWIPLATIAYTLHEDWYEKAIDAMKELSGYHVDADDSTSIMILEDLRSIFQKDGQPDKLSSSDIIDNLLAMDDRPWSEWRHGKGLSTTGLAQLLKPYQLRPKTIRINDQKTIKGYLPEHFQDAFSRYLPPIQSVTTSQLRKNNYLEQNKVVPQKNAVTDKKQCNALKSKECYAVTDENTPLGEEMQFLNLPMYSKKEIKELWRI